MIMGREVRDGVEVEALAPVLALRMAPPDTRVLDSGGRVGDELW